MRLLYQLQNLEAAEKAILLERAASEEYQNLRKMKVNFEIKKEQYVRSSAEIKALEQQVADFSSEQSQLEQKLEQEKSALYDGSVTGTKSLSARESQIAALEKKIELLLEKKEYCQAEIDEKQGLQNLLGNELLTMQASFQTVKHAYQIAQADRDQRLQELQEAKDALLSQISEEKLRWYHANRDHFSGAPVAMLDAHQVCSGCRTIVPMVTYKRTLQGQRVFCEKCGRILFVTQNED